MIKINETELPYFVLEGLDGVGKSSLIPLVKDALEDIGYKVRTIQEPSDNYGEKHLVNWLAKPVSKSPIAVAMVQYAARIQQFNRLNCLKHTDNTIVLADRSYLSTFVYQGSAIAQSLFNVSGLPKYDYAFHIKVPYDIAMDRIDSRSYKDENDITDKKKYKKMANKYSELCDTDVDNSVRLVAANEIVNRILAVLNDLGRTLPIDVKK